MLSGVTTELADLFSFFTGIAGHTLNHEFGPVTPTTQYYFTITANTSGGQSPPAAIQAVQTSSGMCYYGIIFSCALYGEGYSNLHISLLDHDKTFV